MIDICNKYNRIFCNAFNKYYNTLEINGEISKKESENLLIIGYIRKLLNNPTTALYGNILIKALRCIANKSCLLDAESLYNMSSIPKVDAKYSIVSRKEGSCVSIIRVEKTESHGLEDIYTIKYSNGNTTNFTVTNGEQGPVGPPAEVDEINIQDIKEFWNRYITTQ